MDSKIPPDPPYDRLYTLFGPTDPVSTAPYPGDLSHVPGGRVNAAAQMNNSLVATHNPMPSRANLPVQNHSPNATFGGIGWQGTRNLKNNAGAERFVMSGHSNVGRAIFSNQIIRVPPPLVDVDHPYRLHSSVNLPVQNHAPNAMLGGNGWKRIRHQINDAGAERLVMSGRGNAYQRRHEVIRRRSSFVNAASAINTTAAPAPSAGGQKNNFKSKPCTFAHDEEGRKHKISLCPSFFSTAGCPDNPCCFAHSVYELPYPEKFKTQSCRFYLNQIPCPYGNLCLYAHSKSELPPQGA